MIFIEICKEYIDINKKVYYTYLLISSISYITKVIISPMIYSNIMDLKDGNNYINIIKQISFLWLFMSIIYIIKLKIENKFFTEFLSFIRKKLFRNYLEKNKINFNDSNVSTDITRIFEVTRYIKELFAWISQSVIPISILTLSINFYFLYNIPILGIINFICNSSIYLYVYSNFEKLIDSSNKRELFYMKMVTKFDENFNNLLNIYLNNQIEETILDNEKIESEYTDIYKSQNQETINFINYLKVINYLFAFISIYILFLKRSHINPKQFINILLIFTFYISTLEVLADDIPCYIMIAGNIKNSEIFFKKIEEDDVNTKLSIPNLKGNIKIDDISFKYENSSDYIIKNFSLNIDVGERIGILGKTGKGKSTLMKLLLNFYKIQKGNIYFDDINIKNIDVDDIRKNINYINQKTNLFNDTVINNIKYGNNKDDDYIINFIKKYDLLSVFNPSSPNNTDCLYNIIEKNGSNLSLGMQKVIFLIRGILKSSQIFIIDEPFSSIDEKTRKNVLRMIDEITKGKTLIIITHDKEGIIDILDRIIYL
jgi:ABC-type multidrug transport system fused ATPase/permease subunit